MLMLSPSAPSMLFIIAALVVTCLCAGLCVYIKLQRTGVPGAGALAGLQLALAIWAATSAGELIATDLPGKIVWDKVSYFGTASVPLAFLLFALRYTGVARWLTRTRVLALAFIPVVTLLLALTNDLHRLFWTAQWLSPGELAVRAVHGLWFWLFTADSYAMLAAGVCLLVWRLRHGAVYRYQAAALGIACLVPSASSVMYVLGRGPAGNLDVTPLAFGVSGLVMAWGFARSHLLDVVPIARDAIFDDIQDAVLVLDDRQRVLDLNAAAGRLLGSEAAGAIGRSAAVLFSASDRIAQWLADPSAPAEVAWNVGHELRTYELRSTPVRGDGRIATGRLMLMRDVTERIQAASERAERERAEAAREFAERAHRREAFLSDMSAVLGGALDVREMLLHASRLAVPHLASWCGFVLTVGPEPNRLMASSSEAPIQIEDGGDEAASWLNAITLGETVRLPAWPTRLRPVETGGAGVPPQAPSVLPAPEAPSVVPAPQGPIVLLPLVARGHVLGAMALAQPHEDGIDLHLAEEVARRVALATDTAVLYDAAEREIAARKRAEAMLRRQAVAMDAAVDGMAILDRDGRHAYANQALAAMYGYATANELVGVHWTAHYVDDEDQRVLDAAAPVLRQTGEWRGEATARGVDARVFPVDLSLALLDEGGLVCVVRDSSARKQAEAEMERLAFRDALTDLPNRALFLDRLEHTLARTRRSGSLAAALFIDLDNFKLVNDSLGHHAGDALLTEVAARLARCLRQGDTAARMGGDEFAVLLEEPADEDAAVAVAERIGASLREAYVIEGREIGGAASIGVAVTRGQADTASDLLRKADLALYRAKAAGKARVARFDPAWDTEALDRLELESDLRHALERGEFRVYYQPILTLSDAHLVEVEALLRWEHPARGLIPPAEFIPLAEESGLILEIGQWVLEEACRQTRWWQLRNPLEPPLVVSVNLSAKQFEQPDLVGMVARALQSAGLPPTCLKLEVTESVLMRDIAANRATLLRLQALGVQVAIDDFGTGYSSLSYIKQLPVDTLKIDRSFVNGLGQDAQDTAIVRTVVMLARSLGLTVTGEGVETAAQADLLRDLGCQRGQGYLFARPAPADQVAPLLQRATHADQPQAA